MFGGSIPFYFLTKPAKKWKIIGMGLNYAYTSQYPLCETAGTAVEYPPGLIWNM
jgi:hypothetical protein